MPKKRHHAKSFKPSSAASPTQASPTSATAAKAPRSVNELLANLRHASTSSGQQSAASREFTAATPSVPPAIREILQIPETPAPLPRRPIRQRFDRHGRRLPAGPPPPQSWTTRRADGVTHGESDAPATFSRAASSLLSSQRGVSDTSTTLPGAYLPAAGSLIDILLRKLALDWSFHRVYDQHHLYFVPSHLKPALIRWVSLVSDEGISAQDLRTILLPPQNTFANEELEAETASNARITHVDLSGSLGHSLRVKDVSDLLFPTTQTPNSDLVQDTWDTVESAPNGNPTRALLPNLTHLSLALDAQYAPAVSWRQLLSLSSKLSTVTHLSLAFWPDPCLTRRARLSSVMSPQGQAVPYAGTNYYSHSIDHDWSEAVLVLRMLSQRLYELEFLDLSGCAPWFKALVTTLDHDYVDWAGNWGKVTRLRLYSGCSITEDTPPSRRIAFREAIDMAGSIEKHIVAMRAGKGRFITVERDRLDT